MIQKYDDLSFNAPEMCIVLEKFNILEPGVVKARIPVFMPFIEEGEPKDTGLNIDLSNIDNDDADLDIEQDAKTANYINLKLPNHVTDVTRDMLIIPVFEKNMRGREYRNFNGGLIEPPDDDIFDDIEYGKIEDLEIEDDTIQYRTNNHHMRMLNPYVKQIKVKKRYFFELEEYDEEKKILYAKKNCRFIIVCIGGDISNIRIIGRYDECSIERDTLSQTYYSMEPPWTLHTTGLPL